MNPTDDISLYLIGKKLYGDDFNVHQIASLFRDEAEAYADLGAGNASQYHLCVQRAEQSSDKSQTK